MTLLYEIGEKSESDVKKMRGRRKAGEKKFHNCDTKKRTVCERCDKQKQPTAAKVDLCYFSCHIYDIQRGSPYLGIHVRKV